MLPSHRRALLLVISLLLAGLTPTQAWAADEVDKYLTAAIRLYEQLEYERALQHLAQARLRKPKLEQDVTLSLYEGLIHAEMSHWEEASAAFKAGLYLKPDAQLPVKVSPKVRDAFEAARKEVEQELAQARPRQKPPPQEQKVVAAPAHAAPAAPVGVEERRSSSRVLLPAVVGGGLLAAGGVMWGLAWNERSRLRSDDAGFTTREDVHRSASRGRTYQTVGFTLMGAGVVGLGIAAGLHLMGAPAPVAVGATREGAVVLVSGSLP